MIFETFPIVMPVTPLLDRVESPADMKGLTQAQLVQLANELRAYLLYSVSQSGGHFGAGLGVIELTIALHYVFNTPDDNLIWDVGHQAYPHKILTGRKSALLTIRQQDGLAAFPRREESIYDAFGVGHSSTSISAALGMAVSGALQGHINKHIAVIGDGALTAGMAFEALNHATHQRANMLVVLNDNNMSISENVGGVNTYLAKKTQAHATGIMATSTLFEELGFHYSGPVDGHDLPELVRVLAHIKTLDGPQFLHVVTTKGKGFLPAEKNPISYHAINKLEIEPSQVIVKANLPPKYSHVFGQWICDEAARDDRLVAITPAMCDGSGLGAFAAQFPERYHDVAIAEQHAVTFAAGLACEGSKPVVAIYSTFLQRAYDQLIHDVCVQNLDVLFAIDRAGLVGEDGPTHAGAFDISFLRCIPNIVLMAPADENETRQMLHTGYHLNGPVAVRYPRGRGTGCEINTVMAPLPIGKSRCVADTLVESAPQLAILAFGSMVATAIKVAEQIPAKVINMRFIKPLDVQVIALLADECDVLVTLEENVIMGGAGSAVLESLMQQNKFSTPIKLFGLPDQNIEHANHQQMMEACRLDVTSLVEDMTDFVTLHSRISK